MDGLLLDSEDAYTLVTNTILHRHGRPTLPWSIKAQMQGRPGPSASKIFHEWAKLPIDNSQFLVEQKALQEIEFPKCQPLPGVEKLLGDLAIAKVQGGREKVHIALATSSHKINFEMKTGHLTELFEVFEGHRRVLGDDERIPPNRGKPAPDIYLLALSTINNSLAPGEKPISPEECLVFEDSVPGVESGRRAGMRVVWCPHPELKKEFGGQEKEVLAGRTTSGSSEDMHQVGELDDGWADYLESLVDFPYARYGIEIPK